LSGSSYKRFTLQVFVFARALANEQNIGVFVANAEHHIMACGTKTAVFAVLTSVLQFVPRFVHQLRPLSKIADHNYFFFS
jgi:hypothetical protein